MMTSRHLRIDSHLLASRPLTLALEMHCTARLVTWRRVYNGARFSSQPCTTKRTFTIAYARHQERSRPDSKEVGANRRASHEERACPVLELQSRRRDPAHEWKNLQRLQCRECFLRHD